MTRIVITLALLASCSSAAKRESTTGGESVPVVMAKKVAVSWGITKVGEMADIFLATTDETGKQVSHPVGTYAGQCAVVTPAPEMKAVIGVACKDGATGTELHVVFQDPDIIVLKMRIDEGVTPDPMSREEVTRVKAPLGASVSAG